MQNAYNEYMQIRLIYTDRVALFSMTLLEYLLKDKEGQKKEYFGGKKVDGFVFFSTIFCKNLP